MSAILLYFSEFIVIMTITCRNRRLPERYAEKIIRQVYCSCEMSLNKQTNKQTKQNEKKKTKQKNKRKAKKKKKKNKKKKKQQNNPPPPKKKQNKKTKKIKTFSVTCKYNYSSYENMYMQYIEILEMQKRKIYC